MDLNPFFKSIVDQDTEAVVICDTAHIIIYMNPAAIEEYNNRGGANLIGLQIFDCHRPSANERIRQVFDWFEKSKEHNIVHTLYIEEKNMDLYMVALRDDEGELIGYYEKQVHRSKDCSGFYQF